MTTQWGNEGQDRREDRWGSDFSSDFAPADGQRDEQARSDFLAGGGGTAPGRHPAAAQAPDFGAGAELRDQEQWSAGFAGDSSEEGPNGPEAIWSLVKSLLALVPVVVIAVIVFRMFHNVGMGGFSFFWIFALAFIPTVVRVVKNVLKNL